MKIIFFSHPSFFRDTGMPDFLSMPRFTNMLADGMGDRGHNIEIWTPKPMFCKFPAKGVVKKWLGYIDSFFLFPVQVYFRVKKCPADTLFVITDQAQGMWVPLIVNRHHVIHCHDFLAQHSALGNIPENPISKTGKIYQKLIFRGYSKGKHFISVSKKTREELHCFLPDTPIISEQVYNGINKYFKPSPVLSARKILSKEYNLDLSSGYLLHVGGNQFYKNRGGVIEIYNAWRQLNSKTLPLLLIGEKPTAKLLEIRAGSPFKADIHFLNELANEFVCLAYTGASVFIFPSLAEGFGWPIAEAMATGCPVVTTNEAPMTEVAGNAGYFIPRRDGLNVSQWACKAAEIVKSVTDQSESERKLAFKAAVTNAKRFNSDEALNRIELIYQSIVSQNNN